MTSEDAVGQSGRDAMYYLGMMLMVLQDLHPDDQCKAWGDAMAFYNAANPDARIEPNAGYSTRLIHETPLSRAIANAQQSDHP